MICKFALLRYVIGGDFSYFRFMLFEVRTNILLTYKGDYIVSWQVLSFFFLVLCFHTLSSQINFQPDTAGIQGVMEMYEYDETNIDLENSIQSKGIKRFDKKGRITEHEFSLYGEGNTKSKNIYYYNNYGKICRIDKLFFDEDLKSYITDSTFYYYSRGKIDSVRDYEYERLNGADIYYSSQGKIIKFWNYYPESGKRWVFKEDLYNKQGKQVKCIWRDQPDTMYYYYDKLGRDSLRYFVNDSKPHSITTYSYLKFKKLEHVHGILFPNNYDVINTFDESGKILSIEREDKDESSNVVYSYYPNGLVNGILTTIKKKSELKTTVSIKHFHYTFY